MWHPASTTTRQAYLTVYRCPVQRPALDVRFSSGCSTTVGSYMSCTTMCNMFCSTTLECGLPGTTQTHRNSTTSRNYLREMARRLPDSSDEEDEKNEIDSSDGGGSDDDDGAGHQAALRKHGATRPSSRGRRRGRTESLTSPR